MDELFEQLKYDVEQGYLLPMEHGLVSNLGLRSVSIVYNRLNEENLLYYKIDIRMPNMTSILDGHIIRYFYQVKLLWSARCENKEVEGKVIDNTTFLVKQIYQKRGLGKLIYSLENNLYRKWGVEEIQLVAIRLGKIVWRKFDFLIHCDDIYLLEYLYQEWCSEKGIEYVESLSTNLYPEDFLLCSKVKHFRMYKVLKNV